MKRTTIFLSSLVIFLLIIGFTQYPKLTIITGFTAKAMASTVFLSDRSPESVQAAELQEPLIRFASSTYQTNDNTSYGTSQIMGMQERIAICEQGLGCVLVPPGISNYSRPPEKPLRSILPDTLPYPLGVGIPKDTVFPEVDYALLEAAMNGAFANPETQRTNSVLVLYKDHLLAERYDNDITTNTRVLGWSMTKSILATLYGIRIFNGDVDVMSRVNWRPWAEDSRNAITYDDLLRMQSGLEWDEDYAGISDATRMLFLSEDMTVVQSQQSATAEPGMIWNYSSGTTNFLSGLLRRDLVDYQEYLDYPYRELIDRIGMRSMILETDYAGNYVASSYGWATTRDWAKFGLLYLHNGNWNGTQIFAPNWVDYITRPTNNSGGQYGAHFWLNVSGTFPDAPRDVYSANGFQGQYVFIVPSKDLVIVRTGMAESPNFDANAFLRRLISAIKE